MWGSGAGVALITTVELCEALTGALFWSRNSLQDHAAAEPSKPPGSFAELISRGFSDAWENPACFELYGGGLEFPMRGPLGKAVCAESKLCCFLCAIYQKAFLTFAVSLVWFPCTESCVGIQDGLPVHCHHKGRIGNRAVVCSIFLLLFWSCN